MFALYKTAVKKMKKFEWIALNIKHGDLTRCALAHKYDKGYLREVSKGRSNNPNMLDKLISFIKEMRAIEQISTVNDEFLLEPVTQA